MSFKDVLKKAGLVEEGTNLYPPQGSTTSYSNLYTEPQMEVVEIAPEELSIQTIWSENSFEGTGVYQLQAYMQTLPDTMSESQKVQVVLGILKASNLSIDELLTDGSKRIDCLISYRNNLLQESQAFIKKTEEAIASLQAEIEKYNAEVNSKVKLDSDVDSILKNECELISKIIFPFNQPNIIKNKEGTE